MPKSSWQNYSTRILDEINIFFLRLLGMIDMHFSQAKGKTNNDIAVLVGLALVIVMGHFYQFSSVIGQFL